MWGKGKANVGEPSRASTDYFGPPMDSGVHRGLRWRRGPLGLRSEVGGAWWRCPVTGRGAGVLETCDIAKASYLSGRKRAPRCATRAVSASRRVRSRAGPRTSVKKVSPLT